MYIINEHGILNGWPDEWALPAGSRKATKQEIACFQATGQQNVAKMELPEDEQAPAVFPDLKPKRSRKK